MTYMSQCGYCSSGAGGAYGMGSCSGYRGNSGRGSYNGSASSISYISQNSSTGYNSALNTLEAMVKSHNDFGHSSSCYASSLLSVPLAGYKASKTYSNHTSNQAFDPEIFLNPSRQSSPFVGEAWEISHYVSEAFRAAANSSLPDDVIVEVVSPEELKEKHEKLGGQWNPGIQGFSINRQGFGKSMIFAKQNQLDKLMITIGHELGHILTFTLDNPLDEEAKAFAFEMAWIKAMHENNTANLAMSLNMNPLPANNGLHDVAFNFVQKELKRGKNGLELFREISKREIRVNKEIGREM